MNYMPDGTSIGPTGGFLALEGVYGEDTLTYMSGDRAGALYDAYQSIALVNPDADDALVGEMILAFNRRKLHPPIVDKIVARYKSFDAREYEAGGREKFVAWLDELPSVGDADTSDEPTPPVQASTVATSPLSVWPGTPTQVDELRLALVDVVRNAEPSELTYFAAVRNLRALHTGCDTPGEEFVSSLLHWWMPGQNEILKPEEVNSRLEEFRDLHEMNMTVARRYAGLVSKSDPVGAAKPDADEPTDTAIGPSTDCIANLAASVEDSASPEADTKRKALKWLCRDGSVFEEDGDEGGHLQENFGRCEKVTGAELVVLTRVLDGLRHSEREPGDGMLFNLDTGSFAHLDAGDLKYALVAADAATRTDGSGTPIEEFILRALRMYGKGECDLDSIDSALDRLREDYRYMERNLATFARKNPGAMKRALAEAEAVTA